MLLLSMQIHLYTLFIYKQKRTSSSQKNISGNIFYVLIKVGYRHTNKEFI